MIWMRGAVTLALGAVLACAAAGCGSSGAKADAGGAGTGGAGAGGSDGGDAAGGAGGDGGQPDAAPDLAMDFGGATESDVAINCPTGGGALAPAAAAVLIDDFSNPGKLDGRTRAGTGFEVREQFSATPSAHFDPEPRVETKCGAAAAGAAHVRGEAADTGATFAMIFSGGGEAGAPSAKYDASGKKGISFRVALGDAKAPKLVTVQVNVAGSNWDYTKDVIVNGTAWQEVTVLWTDLQAAAAAPKFSAAALNQIVLPFASGEMVDLYVDDVAFVP